MNFDLAEKMFDQANQSPPESNAPFPHKCLEGSTTSDSGLCYCTLGYQFAQLDARTAAILAEFIKQLSEKSMANFQAVAALDVIKMALAMQKFEQMFEKANQSPRGNYEF